MAFLPSKVRGVKQKRAAVEISASKKTADGIMEKEQGRGL
jgi:hypothetical protein